MHQTARIYLFSVILAVSVVMLFFFVQTFLIMKNFQPRMILVPLTLGLVLGLLAGRIQILQARLAERNRLFSALMDFALEFTYFRRISGEYEYVSPACKAITGYEQVDFYRQPNFMDQLIHPDDRKIWEGHIHNINGEGVPEMIEFRILTRDGQTRWIEHLCSTVQGNEGQTTGVRSTNVDITRRKQYEQQVEYSAKYDHLTGLPNRRWLMTALKERIASVRGRAAPFAVMFLDLDRFKYINDTFGHAIGDILLRKIADQFRGLDGDGNLIVSRFGGDEFVIVESLDADTDPVRTASRFLAILDRSFAVDGHDFSVTGSIGIAIFPDDGDTPEDLIKNADAAMYKAKREGKNNIQRYSADLAKAISDFYHLEQQLKLAVERDEFILHYQPQVELASGRVVAVEALLRWNSREHGLIPPLQFIPVAEETGLIHAIGELVFRKACAQWRAWFDQGISLRMAVNVSPIQFRDVNFTDQLEKLLQAARMPPDRLEIEITEGVLMGDVEQAMSRLNRIHETGISIAIDDFGTGYSSLEYLKQLPINCLKIDASFVSEVQCSARDLAIVKTIETLARNLQIHTVAEGIEQAVQYECLKGIGCALGQGYFISRPMPAESLEALLRKGIS